MSGINAQELVEVFSLTTTADNLLRERAERRLAEIERMENYVPTLLQLTTEQSIPSPIRQSVAIRFKNHVTKRWKNDLSAIDEENGFNEEDMIGFPPQSPDDSDEPSLSEADKNAVKDRMYEACVTQTEGLIRKQLLEALLTICRMEWPTRWPSLMPNIERDLSLSQEHVQRVYGSICVLKTLCKKYQFRMRKIVHTISMSGAQDKSVLTQAALPPNSQDVHIRRNILDDIIEATWPRLVEIASDLVKMRDNNDVYEMLKPIFQIFYIGIHMGLPMHLLDAEGAFEKWMEVFLSFLRQPIPAELIRMSQANMTSDNANGLRYIGKSGTRIHPFAKAQKWAVRCVTRIFMDHGRYQYVPANLKEFARKFQHEMAPIFLDCILENIIKVYVDHCGKNSGVVGSNNSSSVVYYKTLTCALSYVTVCIHYGNLCRKLLEQFDVLMSRCLFPLVCLNVSDLELWNDNPSEFVKQLYCDLAEEKYDPRAAALKAVVEFVRIRSSYTATKVLDFMSARVSEYDGIVARCNGNFENPEVQQAAIHKDGALTLLGELDQQIKNGDSNLKKALEALLREHIVGDFGNARVGFLRFRACKFVGQYFEMKMSDEGLKYQLAECVTNCLNDSELPVRLEAANAFTAVIQHDGVLQHLSGSIAAILERYLMLMDEIGIEVVMSTFDIMMGRLGDNLAPFAEQLTDRMIALFNQLHSDIVNTADENEAENLILSASQVLKSISTIVFAVHPLPPLLRTIQMKLFPLFETYFNQQNGENYVLELLDIIGAVTYYDGPDLHPFLWERVLPNLIEMHMNWCDEYLNRVVNIIATFICLRHNANLTEFLFTDGSTRCDFIDNFFRLYVHCIKDDNIEPDSLGSLTDVMFSYLRPNECHGGGVPNAQPTQTKFSLHKYIPHLLEVCCSVLAANELRPKVENCALHTIAAAMFYDPKFFLTVATQQGMLQPLFEKYKANMKEMTWPEQKIVVFGFSEILSVDLNECPRFLIDSMPALIDMIATLVCYMNWSDEEEDDDDSEEDSGDSDDEETGDDDEEVDDISEDDEDDEDADDEDEDDEDEEYEKPFLNLDIEKDYTDPGRINETSKANAILSANESELMEYLEQCDNHVLPKTPFDQEDEVIAFNNAIQRIGRQNMAIVDAWRNNTSEEKLKLLEEHLNVAKENIQAVDKKQLREKQKQQQKQARLQHVMKEASERQRAQQSQPWLT